LPSPAADGCRGAGYGVLEELAPHRSDGERREAPPALREGCDLGGVGGTFPATYYALRGEKTFEEFEAKVLARNFEPSW